MTNLDNERLINLLQKYLELYLPTCQDVTRKPVTWKAISTKLIVLQLNLHFKVKVDNICK